MPYDNRMGSITFVIFGFLIFAYALGIIESAKILAVFPFTGPSQYMCVQMYLKTLASRGHEVTSVSAFPQKTPIENFRDITIKAEQEEHDEMISAYLEDYVISKLDQLRSLQEYAEMNIVPTFQNEEFQRLLHSNVNFDLIIIEVVVADSLYALGSHFNAPIIGVSTFGTDVVIDQLVDNISPVAYVPAPSGAHLDRMNFWQRLDNLYVYTMELLYAHFIMLPVQQRLYETYFPNATLKLSEVRRDFSLLLLNQHYSYSWPRPLVPNAIEVAGMHINNTLQKLPADMEDFINASPKGAIYFSLGSNIKSVFLPKEKINAIMDAFASLPVNVLWKFERTELPGKPKNVFINKWFPQSEILAHKNVKLFITHGGMHSTIEVVHHGKPIVGMPVFYDQHLNVQMVLTKGFGVAVNFRNFTSAELRDAILEVLNNPKYAEKAREACEKFHDRPMKPLDAAIYWTDYVLRHKGAPQMRVAARHLNFLQRHSVDTMAVLFGIPLLLVVFIIRCVCKIVIGLCGKKHGATHNVKKPKRE